MLIIVLNKLLAHYTYVSSKVKNFMEYKSKWLIVFNEKQIEISIIVNIFIVNIFTFRYKYLLTALMQFNFDIFLIVFFVKVKLFADNYYKMQLRILTIKSMLRIIYYFSIYFSITNLLL